MQGRGYGDVQPGSRGMGDQFMNMNFWEGGEERGWKDAGPGIVRGWVGKGRCACAKQVAPLRLSPVTGHEMNVVIMNVVTWRQLAVLLLLVKGSFAISRWCVVVSCARWFGRERKASERAHLEPKPKGSKQLTGPTSVYLR